MLNEMRGNLGMEDYTEIYFFHDTVYIENEDGGKESFYHMLFEETYSKDMQ